MPYTKVGLAALRHALEVTLFMAYFLMLMIFSIVVPDPLDGIGTVLEITVSAAKASLNW